MDYLQTIRDLEKKLEQAESLEEQFLYRLQQAQFLHFTDELESRGRLEKLEADLPKIQNENLHGWFHFNKGWHFFDSGDFEMALQEFSEAISYFSLVEGTYGQDGLASAHNGIGNVLVHMGEFDQALPVLHEAIELSQHTSNSRQEMDALRNLGSAYKAQKRFKEARKTYRKSLEYFIEIKEEMMVLLLNIDIGSSYRLENQAAQGRKWLKKVEKDPLLPIYSVSYCDYYLELAYCDLIEDKLEQALENAEKGIEIANKEKVGSRILQLLILKSEILIALDDLDSAQAVLDSCSGDRTQRLHLQRLEMLSFISDKKGNIAEAFRYQKELYHEYSQIYNLNQKSSYIISRLSEMEQQQKRNQQINAIGKKITRLLDLDELIQYIFSSLKNLLKVDILGIGKLSEGALHFEHYIEGGHIIKGNTIPANSSSSFAIWVIQNGRSILINDVKVEKHYYLTDTKSSNPIETKEKIQSLIFIPLHYEGETVGVFTIQSYQTNAYTIGDLGLLQALESYTTIAMENAQKAKQLENLAELDFLTGIANRRKLDVEFNRIVSICRRHESNVSVLMIDVDHFKKFNDNFGHDQGDQCLQMIASVLKDTFKRPLDTFGRQGGEEFLIVMGETNKEQGQFMAERLRKKVSDESNQCKSLPEGFQLTISIGGISFAPSKLKKVDMLQYLKKADTALYEAKHNGRNRVCWFS